MEKRSWRDDYTSALSCIDEERYVEAIYDLHTCATILIEEYYPLSEGTLYFLDGIKRLYKDNIIEKAFFEALKELNKLRNKNYHRRYKPTKNEATLSKNLIINLIKKLGFSE